MIYTVPSIDSILTLWFQATFSHLWTQQKGELKLFKWALIPTNIYDV